jgi:hypothetical protein
VTTKVGLPIAPTKLNVEYLKEKIINLLRNEYFGMKAFQLTGEIEQFD